MAQTLTELDKLENLLRGSGYEYVRDDAEPDEDVKFNRHQIRVFEADYTRQIASIICHYGSYGYEQGLLEVMGDVVDHGLHEDGVEGFLSADEVFERLENYYGKEKS